MNDMGSIIRRLREEKGWTQEQLANKLGVQAAAVAKYESGIVTNIKQSVIRKLAKVLEVNPSYLFGWVDEAIDPSNFEVVNLPITKIPIIGSVACGSPILAEENIEGYMDPIQYVHADFCLIAKGDSMIDAGINDGDVVYVKKTQSVENGQLAVVLIGNEATLKRFYKTNDGYMLLSENKKYPPMTFSKFDPLSIVGLPTHITKVLE